ncbi:MAG: CoA-transferase [Desulfatirhabdiaceae bacterium]
MQKMLQTTLDHYFRVEEEEGVNKVLPLEEAVRQCVHPGMSLHFSFTHNRAHAAAFEIARQFWGRNPEFTLIATGILEYGILLIYGGLIKKAVAAFYGDSYPTSSPNPIIQQALADGRLSLESWTNLTIPLRLMAGAYNLPSITTNSIRGSTMEIENQHAYRLIDDPLSPGGKVGLMSSLQPDLTIIHGGYADAYGNTVLIPPYGENMWGVFASRTGVMVTVEEIVPTSTIRNFSHLVKIPGHLVKSVSVVPFGAHPQGMSNHGEPGMVAYGEDQPFRMHFRQATRDLKQFDSWVKHWVLGCTSHEDYLKKLGYERLMGLKGKAGEDSWTYDIQEKASEISITTPVTPAELMVSAASGIIQKKVLENGYKNILGGIGISCLSASLAYYLLKKKSHHVDLLVETGLYGYAPRPGDPFIFNFSNMATNKIQSNFVEILNLFAGGNGNQCLGVLAAGQVDQHGNLNSTRLENGRYLVGAGGSNDVVNGAAETIVVLRQSKKRFVKKVPYVTCCGQRVSTVISDMGVFEKVPGQDELILSACLPRQHGVSRDEAVELIKNHCGWELKIAPDLKDIPMPGPEEIPMMRLLDPKGYFIS